MEETKGDRTRAQIIHEAAALFNQRGYAGASISDVMKVTGLEKGGIYNHFKNKEQLALEAFDYGFSVATDLMLDYLRETKSPLERLRRTVNFFQDYYERPPVQGGCVLLNTAVDSDDSNPELRQRAQDGMNQWEKLVVRIILSGIDKGEIRPEVDAESMASFLIASLEGGIMMSQLYKAPEPLNRVVEHLLAYIDLMAAAN